jgi:hypothetical protein
MKRATLFALTGLVFFAFWFVAKPSFDVSPTQGEWPQVLAFSAMILTLAFAVPQFARLVGGRFAIGASRVVAAGAALSSVANVLEDGLKMEWAFFAFVAGLAITELALLALAIALVARGGKRHFALVPAGTIAGILLYVVAGGPLMLVTWLLAAGFALAPTRNQASAVVSPR